MGDLTEDGVGRQLCDNVRERRARRSCDSADPIRGRRGGDADWDSRCKSTGGDAASEGSLADRETGAASVPEPHAGSVTDGERNAAWAHMLVKGNVSKLTIPQNPLFRNKNKDKRC